MPVVRYLRQPATVPARWIVALAVSPLLAGMLPGGGWGDTLALLASVAALFAALERRDRDMLIAAGLAAGLAPAGMLLAPLLAGLAIRRHATGLLPVSVLVGLSVQIVLPWSAPASTLPNLAVVASDVSGSLALIVALGVGIAAWLGARASVLPPSALMSEARLGAILMALALPLPVGVLAFVLTLAALPLPSPPRPSAANDNIVRRQTIRLAA